MTTYRYTEKFFAELRDGVARSAGIVVPLVLDLVPVRSVVDVGCGEGAWLAEFQRLGVNDILGVDGDYVGRKALRIAPADFRAMDLSEPVVLDRTFDLAISLEVAEHLDAGLAEQFVESLTRLASVVLFSAAVPFQGGVHHVNEQWPDVWVALFEKFGFVAIDCIRRRIWENTDVEWWYAQNTILFVRTDVLEGIPALKREFDGTRDGQIRLVHPRNYTDALRPVDPPDWRVRTAARLLFVCLQNAVRRRVASAFGGTASSGNLRNPPNFNAMVTDATLYDVLRRPSRE